MFKINLKKLNDYCWQFESQNRKGVTCRVYADQDLLAGIQGDGCLKQLSNVACLPGSVGPVLLMPDAHQGYGMPIGGVCALDANKGAIPPGGVGYDINCGVRLLRSKLAAKDVANHMPGLASALAAKVPAGVGVGGGVTAKGKELDSLLRRGAAWAVERGYGSGGGLEYIESRGCLAGAEPEAVSQRARERGAQQLGTLGAGNHFVELAEVCEIYDQRVGEGFGLWEGQLVLWIHSGSRGLGHQVCDDYLRQFGKFATAPAGGDRQLAAEPLAGEAARSYLAAMAAAANFAFANRQVLASLAVEALQEKLGMGPSALGISLVYDLAHNIAKPETHQVNGVDKRLWILRKGATRALGPGHAELPAQYRPAGQPVLLPGDMGRVSYVLAGTEYADQNTFSSSAHGAGRRLSRTKAKKLARGRSIAEELAAGGIQVRAARLSTLAEEMPEAYKEASKVVEVLHQAGVARKVAKTRPLAVVKG